LQTYFYFEGNANLIQGKKYHVIIAKINRNILLNDIIAYAKSLSKNGTLFLSEFYKEDISIIEAECNKHNLNLVKILERNNWVSLKFVN